MSDYDAHVPEPGVLVVKCAVPMDLITTDVCIVYDIVTCNSDQLLRIESSLLQY